MKIPSALDEYSDILQFLAALRKNSGKTSTDMKQMLRGIRLRHPSLLVVSTLLQKESEAAREFQSCNCNIH